jgi:hypothetical protein
VQKKVPELDSQTVTIALSEPLVIAQLFLELPNINGDLKLAPALAAEIQ